MDYRDKILPLARIKPILHSDVARHLGTTTIIAGAMLSEMVSKKILKISNIKIGSSPLYYLPQNVAMLESYARNLDTKSLTAFELLKEKKILRQSEQSPLVRVCLKQIKDYAKPLEVSFAGSTEIFYKWFLLSDDEATAMIKKILKPEPEVKDTPKIEPPERTVDKELKKKVEKVERIEKKEDILEKKTTIDTTKTIEKIVKQNTLKKIDDSNDTFLKEIIDYCNNKGIVIVSHEVKRKNAEIHLEIKIPSPVGELMYYCLAKSKKKVIESDLSTAYVNGQLRKLPIIFLSRGELSKKAGELLKDLKGISFTSF